MEAKNADVRLVPVIEMAPADYARDGRLLPSHLASSKEWNQYLSDCLADSGIVGLQAVKQRSWHVALEQLTDPQTLEKIVRTHCFRGADEENPEPDIDPDNLLAFSGGYVLYKGDRVMITPRCCADLADIEQWRAAAEHRHSDKILIWIGHPSIEVQFDGTHLLFTEEETDQPAEWVGECSIEPHRLQAAIEHAEQETLAFFDLLLPVVEKMTSPEQAVKIAKTLTALA